MTQDLAPAELTQEAVSLKSLRNSRADKIVEVAVKLFAKRGYASTPIDVVAQEVGVLKGSLYYYIDSKEDLLMAVLDDAHDQVTAIMEEALASDCDAKERLHIWLVAHVMWYLDNVEHATVTFREWRQLSGDRLAVQQERRRGYDAFVKELIAACLSEAGLERQVDGALAERFVVGAINSVAEWYRPERFTDKRVVAQAYADMGLRSVSGKV